MMRQDGCKCVRIDDNIGRRTKKKNERPPMDDVWIEVKDRTTMADMAHSVRSGPYNINNAANTMATACNVHLTAPWFLHTEAAVTLQEFAYQQTGLTFTDRAISIHRHGYGISELLQDRCV